LDICGLKSMGNCADGHQAAGSIVDWQAAKMTGEYHLIGNWRSMDGGEFHGAAKRLEYARRVSPVFSPSFEGLGH
jgi:hypothetical protein